MITRIQDSIKNRLAARKDGESGFTLIELLVVVLIIGILAAIAIPIFLGQQNSAKDSAAKSDAANAALAEAAYYTANNSVYTNTAANLTSYGLTTSVAGSITVTTNTANSVFCVQVLSASATTHFYGVTNTTAPAQGSCAAGVFTATTSPW